MGDQTLAILSQRLDRLEVLAWFFGALLFLMIVLMFARTARSFNRRVVLRDRRGVPRLSLGLTDAGDPSIILWGRDGKSSFSIGCGSEDAPSMMASDGAGCGRLFLTQNKTGPCFGVLYEGGKTAIAAGMLEGDVPGMIVSDRSGKHRFQISFDEAGRPYLAVFDGDTRRLAMGISPGDEPALVLFGKNGEERIGLGFDEAGAPFVHILDEAGGVVDGLQRRPGG